jgi:predicted MPP superfamily phosphohydrolase
MSSLIYNTLLFVADALLIWAVVKRPSVSMAILSLAGWGLGAGVLAGLLGENIFGAFRLLCYAIFLHGVILLAGQGAALRKNAPRLTALCAVCGTLLLAVAADAFLIEPHWLEVSRITVRSPKVRRPVRVALIADFQTDRIGEYERSVFARVLSEKPDLILMAGDHLQEEHGSAMATLREAFRTLIREADVSAPMGIYAVRGNIDHPDWARAFEGLPIVTLGKTRSIDLGELRLTGLSMEDSFNATLSVPPSDRFQIVLGHSPDFALGQAQGDLLLAGHTHGGQVRIPWFGPIMTESRIPRAWAAGVTNLSGGRTLVVSRGIGMERGPAPRLRFLCRPELVVIDIVP